MTELRVWWAVCVSADSDGSARKNLALFVLTLGLTLWVILGVTT